jgi:hypothetical protein
MRSHRYVSIEGITKFRTDMLHGNPADIHISGDGSGTELSAGPM